MKAKFFFTYDGAMAHTKLQRLIGLTYRVKYCSWLGYLSTPEIGDDAVNYWKQFFCKHRWFENTPGNFYDTSRKRSGQMNTCLKCGVVKAGPDK